MMAAWLLVAVLGADAAPRVVVLAPPSTSAALTARLKGELTAAGFEVLLQTTREADLTRAEVRRVGAETNSIAVLALSTQAGSVDAWVEDRVTGKTVIRSLALDDAAVVATRSVELLRASLLELTLQKRPAVPLPAPVLELARPPPPPPPRLEVFLGVSAGAAPNTGAQLGPTLEALWVAWHPLVLAVRVTGPLALGRVNAGPFAATLLEGHGVGLVGAEWSRGPLSLRGLLGAGAHVVSAAGVSAPGVETTTDTAWMLALTASGELGWQVSGPLGLVVGLDLVRATAPARIALGGVVAAEASNPAVLGRVGVSFAL